MVKKRKLSSKSPSAAIRQQKLKQQEEEEQRQQQHVDEDPVEDEEDEQEFGEEVEAEGYEEDEEDEYNDGGKEESEPKMTANLAASVSLNQNDDDDAEPIQKLLEPFSKDQLITILTEAAESHYDVAARIRQIADGDPVHRKIFVHGLGWDTTTETLRNAFGQFGEIEDCKAVSDKVSGKSKGYGFILFKTRSGAHKALQQPQKKIGNRMTACQLAAIGPVPSSAGAVGSVAVQHPASEHTQRKIYVSNVSAELDMHKLTNLFAKYGEIEEGPLGLDRQTGKPKGFCLFIYKSVESAKKALEEPHKNFEGHILHCQRAIDGPKPGKQQQKYPNFGWNDNPSLAGAIGGPPATGATHLVGQSVAGIPYNQGAAAAAQALNPAIGQALTALLASQGAGFGLTNLLGTLGTAGVGSVVNPAVAGGHGLPSGYTNQAVSSSGMLGGYGGQAGLQVAYPNQQVGQAGSLIAMQIQIGASLFYFWPGDSSEVSGAMQTRSLHELSLFHY
ncbi:hypothetical protein Nepgr_009926 [Nepenthes gracilis]|uniref:RRM domain-containing protein n=1 Tax=Nepenthes gracilis TaxID=150966 RepID=A0AAD3XKW5_NEPGR|nr:hypothetical protein Nepgr_009926 [Nepenthes gracilis]